MTTLGIEFVQKRPVKDGYQYSVQKCTVREINYWHIGINSICAIRIYNNQIILSLDNNESFFSLDCSVSFHLYVSILFITM